MGLSVCPSAVVAAPVEVVWRNLVEWERYSEWADVHVERTEPTGPARPGQIVYFAGKALGRTWRFTFRVEAVDAQKLQIGLHVLFPFGLQQKTHVACAAINATTCRVQYG
ncbi:MAG: hypothetical protein JOZ81_13180 [Chloroflexi bacterium]|nr:hypothetical protein [Chloroflexota bacterium]MBV9547251.1 hypothetical protein [Chloroflexota bacterium]